MNTKGFTLIEVLVAVAILAILVALVATGARKFAASRLDILCVNNMRAAAAAIHIMAAEDNNTFRSFQRGNTPAGVLIWGGELLSRGIISEKKMLRCPVAADQYPLDNGAWYYNTYGFNMANPDGTESAPRPDGMPYELRFAAVPEPSKYVMLIDSATSTFISPGVRSESFRVNVRNVSGGVQLRHNEKANAVFLDGHMEAIDRDRALEFFKESIIYDANQ